MLGGHRQFPAILPPGERICTHCTGSWVGPLAFSRCVWRKENIFPHTRIVFRILQLVTSRQGKTRKDGARPALFLIFVLYLLLVLSRSVYCLCVYVYCTANHRVATQLQLNIYHISTASDIPTPKAKLRKEIWSTRPSEFCSFRIWEFVITCKGKVHPCTGTEALYRPYGP